MMIIDWETDSSQSAKEKLDSMEKGSGLFLFPFATEYRKQGKERKYHVFALMYGKDTYTTVWLPSVASMSDMAKAEKQIRAEIEKHFHTEKCLSAREKERTDHAEYEKRWPKYCRKCGGEGGHTDWEYRGEFHGVPASEQVFDYCPHCVEQSICPRCGSISNNFCDDGVGQLRCATCDWREGMPGAPIVLNPYECGCYEDGLDKIDSEIEHELSDQD